MKRYASAAGWALGMLVLILDGKTAIAGAADAVTMCIHTLIPSLFPFFVLSSMLAGSLSEKGLLLAGILGGYPVGAANTARACLDGQVTREQAQKLLVLSNCAGPSFLFGVLGPVLGSAADCFLLWGIYLFSIFALRLLLPAAGPAPVHCASVTLQQAVNTAIRAMAGVCGWVVLFRVLLSFLDRWVLWLLPPWGRITVYGLLELSSGCLSLAAADPGLRLIMAAGMVSFGGLCVFLQTAGVSGGISLRFYFPGKVFQAALCMLLASLLTRMVPMPGFRGLMLCVLAAAGGYLRKNEKRCGNPQPVIV